jgi:hypothetical protein
MLRLIGALVVVAAIVVGVAIYFQWIDVSAKPHDGKTDINVSINRDRFREDVTHFQEKVRNVKPSEVKGKIAAVGVDKKVVTVQHDGGTMDLHVTDGTQIRVGERAGQVADLQAGMRVTATYAVEGGQNAARTIRVEAP